VDIELPFPPSVNHLWRRVGPRTLLSRDGRAYHRRVRNLLVAHGIRPIEGRLAVTVDVHPPDRRRRDLDNLQKGLLDAMQHGGVFHDDSQIDDLHIRRRECVAGGRVRVCVTPVPETAASLEAKPRTCLKCGKDFNSTGPANRICSPCRRRNDRLHISEVELESQRGLKRCNGEILPPLDDR
jgi:crossover junction endodeoxyribonuclease RusA